MSFSLEEKENQLLKKETKVILKKKGMTRGENYLIALFVRKKHGPEGVKRLEEKLSELLHRPFQFPKGRPKEWYPEAEDVLTILTAKYLFHWGNKDIFELGEFHAIHSFTMRILLKYFVSLERIFRETPKYWAKHFDFSSLEGVELNQKDRFLILRIKGYKFHPIMCHFFAGYFYAIARCCLRSEKVTIEERKCVFQGACYHEYLIKW